MLSIDPYMIEELMRIRQAEITEEAKTVTFQSKVPSRKKKRLSKKFNFLSKLARVSIAQLAESLHGQRANTSTH